MSLKCPKLDKHFDVELLIPASSSERIEGVEIDSITESAPGKPLPHPPAQPASAGKNEDWVTAELDEWRKSSAATLRTYATTMLTTSSGGVPVYFAVLKYLGWEQADFGTGLVVLTVLPPALLFLAALAFTFALRPSFSANVEPRDYVALRNRRLGEMYRRATAGTALFGAALLIAITVFVVVMERST